MGLEGVEHTEVHATVDEDTDSRDGEASVDALDTVRLQGLDVDIDQTVELTLSTLAFVVVGQPGPGKVKGVHEEKGQGSGKTTRGNVGGELDGGRSVLGGGEQGLNGVLESKVQSLGREVPQHVSKVSSPEGSNTLGGHHPLGAVKNTGVGLVKTTLLDHLILVLDEQLDSLDGGGHSLGDTSGNTGQHEVLKEPKLLVTHLVFLISCRSESSNKSLVVL